VVIKVDKSSAKKAQFITTIRSVAGTPSDAVRIEARAKG